MVNPVAAQGFIGSIEFLGVWTDAEDRGFPFPCLAEHPRPEENYD